MFWVDETIKEILTRNEKKYLVTDYKTPSGPIHVGALRGVIIHDVIYRGLNDANKKVEYWYGFDDFDPVDALPPELRENYSKYMGVPLCNVPAPDGSSKNFARFFADKFIRVFKILGVKAKVVWGSELYKQGVYNKAIKIVLDNADKIRKIYKEVSGGEKSKDWYPIQVVCPNCGKIGTTRIFNWDGEEVTFKCEKDLIDWAQGCEYEGKISPFNGNGKMPYKVEIAAKWFNFGTNVELAGKDHYTKGGTFYVARAIAEKIFKIKPAYGYGYEWLLIGGKKMSTSKGVGASTEEIAAILPAELLRFLMVRTRAKRTIEFDVSGDTIPLLYDEYDRCAMGFQKDPKSDNGRAYYYSEIDVEKGQSKYFLRFSKVAYMLQMPRVDIFKYAESEKGSKLSKEEEIEIKQRIEIARNWLGKYAPEHYKFEVQEKLPKINLKKEQKEFLFNILKTFVIKKLNGDELHHEIHQVRKEMSINPRDAFSAIYLTFLGKDSGPQVGWFLASLDRDFVVKRLKEAVQ